jgi:hypothetical protein
MVATSSPSEGGNRNIYLNIIVIILKTKAITKVK